MLACSFLVLTGLSYTHISLTPHSLMGEQLRVWDAILWTDLCIYIYIVTGSVSINTLLLLLTSYDQFTDHTSYAPLDWLPCVVHCATHRLKPATLVSITRNTVDIKESAERLNFRHGSRRKRWVSLNLRGLYIVSRYVCVARYFRLKASRSQNIDAGGHESPLVCYVAIV